MTDSDASTPFEAAFHGPKAEAFGVMLRRLRKHRGMYLRVFALKIEQTAAYLSGLELDRFPPPESVVDRCVDALKLTGAESTLLRDAAAASWDRLPGDSVVVDGPKGARVVTLYRPHWASCPNANQHRKANS